MAHNDPSEQRGHVAHLATRGGAEVAALMGRILSSRLPFHAGMHTRLERCAAWIRGVRADRRRLRRVLAMILASVLLGPIILVAPLRFINPPTTAMILARTFERFRQGKTPRSPVRRVVPLGRISRSLVRAVLAAEDDAFYLHDGFDVQQIERALDERKEGRVRGASTISQQTVKNLFLWSERSLVRKGIEAYLTAYLELLLPKDRILDLYLNLVECADGIFGVELCARHHFKASAADLTPEQSARLAAILPSPRKWSPTGAYATSRAREILVIMEKPAPRPPRRD